MRSTNNHNSKEHSKVVNLEDLGMCKSQDNDSTKFRKRYARQNLKYARLPVFKLRMEKFLLKPTAYQSYFRKFAISQSISNRQENKSTIISRLSLWTYRGAHCSKTYTCPFQTTSMDTNHKCVHNMRTKFY